MASVPSVSNASVLGSFLTVNSVYWQPYIPNNSICQKLQFLIEKCNLPQAKKSVAVKEYTHLLSTFDLSTSVFCYPKFQLKSL